MNTVYKVRLGREQIQSPPGPSLFRQGITCPSCSTIAGWVDKVVRLAGHHPCYEVATLTYSVFCSRLSWSCRAPGSVAHNWFFLCWSLAGLGVTHTGPWSHYRSLISWHNVTSPLVTGHSESQFTNEGGAEQL
jgi:hypothetical protein